MKKRLTPFWMHFFVSCFVMIVTITLIISVMFFCIYLNSSNKYNNNNVRNVMQYSQSVLENYFERYSKVVGNMSFAEQIYDVQNEDNDLLYNRNQKYYRILSNVFSVMNDVSSMYLYTNDGFVTRMGDSVYEEKNAKLIREKCKEYDTYNNEMWIYDDGYWINVNKVDRKKLNIHK